MKTQTSIDWNNKASDYTKMSASKEADAYEYEINFPSLVSLCPKDAKTVLDLGCGGGEFTQILSKKYESVVGADVSPNMIEFAKQSFPSLDFLIIDLEQPFPKIEKQFDLVVMKLVLMFVTDIENAASEVSKVVKPNGNVIISVPHPFYWTSDYLLDKYKINERSEFKVLTNGYFSEVPIVKAIGGNKALEFGFIHRTVSTYINTFAKYGLFVDKIDEPQLTPQFIEKYPKYLNKVEIPMRLNIRLRRLSL